MQIRIQRIHPAAILPAYAHGPNEDAGMDLHAALAENAPDQAERMIFLSGGAFTAAARAFLDGVPNQRLEKPFDTRQLSALVNDRMR